MIHRPALLLAGIVFLVLLTAGWTPAEGGDGWHLEFSHVQGNGAQTVVLQMDGEQIRVKDAAEGQEVILGSEAITVLDHEARTYMAITYAQIEATVAPMMRGMKQMANQQKDALRESMENLPPEERAVVEKQLAELESMDEEGPNLAFEDAGQKAVIAGLTARKMLALEDGEPVAEFWVAEEIPIDGLKTLAERFAGMVAEFSYQNDSRFMKALPELSGFPVKVVSLEGGEPEELLTVTEAKRRSFTAADFNPPPGYTKTSMKLGGFGN